MDKMAVQLGEDAGLMRFQSFFQISFLQCVSEWRSSMVCFLETCLIDISGLDSDVIEIDNYNTYNLHGSIDGNRFGHSELRFQDHFQSG
ncbi:hypothetical protein CYMTET_37758 [Cymbomonas tetramitiformis]|uniref:Uncharacterized protein n=1 Tax=Cymbomonas tetramitiformis TaxID=36881 RepID=A0AAE0F5M5_9CHLO|nr:hypothetical protein CYMTET_37758 [Cymbomonas tetramitiformis]